MASSLLTAILGDSISAALAPRVVSYEDVHADAQSVLLPPEYASGLTVHVLQSLNKRFALFHKVGLEPGELVADPMFGWVPGPGRRSYALGALVTGGGGGAGAAKWRASGQLDAENGVGRGALLSDVWGDGRLRVAAAVVDAAAPAGRAREREWALSGTLRGAESVGVLRARNGPELYASYNQHLAPGSAVTVGGEANVSVPELRALAKAAGGGGGGAGARGDDDAGAAPRPLEYTLGAAFDAGAHKTSVHVAVSKAYARGVFSAHHVVRLTERATLAGKIIVNAESKESMAAAGYRLAFRNTATTLHGMIDTYGNTRQVRRRGSATAPRSPLATDPLTRALPLRSASAGP